MPPRSELKRKYSSTFIALIFILAIPLLKIIIPTRISEIGLLWILFILGAIVFATTLTNTDISLFIFIFVVYINLSSVLITNYDFASTARAIVILMSILLLARRILYKDEYHGWIIPALVLGLYAVSGALSLLYAKDFPVALGNLIAYLKNGVVGIIVILLIQRPSSLRTAVWALLSAGIFMGSISVFQQLTMTFTNSYGGFATVVLHSTLGYRSGGPIGDPNYYAQIIVVLLPLAIDHVWNEKKWILKALSAWALFICSLAMVFTYSRGGFLSLMVAFLIMVLLRSTRIPSLMLGLITLIVIFPLIPSAFQGRISSIPNIVPSSRTGDYEDDSIRGRLSENLVAWNLFREHPLSGVGIGNYNTYYQEYSGKLGIDPRLEDRSAHNLYLEIAAEQGLLGLTVFGIVIILTLRQIIKSEALFEQLECKRMANLVVAIGVSFATYLFSSIFLHDAYPRYLWVLYGIAWAAHQSAKYLSHLHQLHQARTLLL